MPPYCGQAGLTEQQREARPHIVSFPDYDLGFFDKDEGRVEPGPNPFAPENV